MNRGKTILILGGGFGGIATARILRSALPNEHRIILVSKSSTFQMGTTKTWIMSGEVEPEKVSRPLNILSQHGIEVLNTEIERIDPSNMAISTKNGDLSADYMVIALGAELDMSQVPGLGDAAETFYTKEGAIRLRDILRQFDGGRIVLLISKIPFQCPPGPYEGAMMLHSYLEKRNLRRKSSIDIYTVEKAPMATAGPPIGQYVIQLLTERGIGFYPQRQVQSVDASGKSVIFADGAKVPYELLIAIPPHTSPRVVRDSGMVYPAGWVPSDPKTLELLGSPSPQRIFVIGDVAGVALPGRFVPDMPLALPKAGIFAERQGEVVAARIAGHILNREAPDVFDGKGFCYIEVGDGKAVRGDGSFFDMPHPTMVPGELNTSQLAEKKEWVSSWMRKYL